MSLVEATTNVRAGFSVAVLAPLIVFPWFGVRLRLTKNLMVVATFAVVSIVRS